MNKIGFILLFAFYLTGCLPENKELENPINIIPQPNKIVLNDGQFELTNTTKLVYKGLDKSILNTISYFQSFVNTSTGFPLEITDAIPSNNYIIFKVISSLANNQEGYELEVSNDKIEISASGAKGLFYAIQSIRQLLPIEIENKHLNDSLKCIIPSLYIKDSPRFNYRGLNLDVARHFYPVEVIKKQLDQLALYKLNVFHWHLTDDQGWRIEIKKYPKLTAIGSKRNKTLVGHAANIPLKYDNKPHEGFYTQEEIKDIVNYAKERHITIIPEIEMPGHALAALASYPELGCTEGPYQVATHWGSFDDVICPGKESSYQILANILSEVAQLFPGDYIHIGGDESSRIRWRHCEHCQKRIKDNELKDEKDLENYFIKRIQQIVTSLGKTMIGWGEIMSDQSLSNATIVVWQDDAEIEKAIINQNNIIKSPNNYLYFDHYQSEPQNHPLSIGGYTTLKDVYHYEPIPNHLIDTEAQAIIGLQANCWTEYMTNQKQIEYMLYPRLCAFSEIAWTNNEQKKWSGFRQKLEHHFERLAALGINYFYEVPKPIINNEQLNFVNTTKFNFENISDKYETRYTTDGSEPDESSMVFTDAIQVKQSGTIKAITINKETGELSKTAIVNLNKLSTEKAINFKGDKKSGLKYSLHQGRFKTVKEIQNISETSTGIVTNSFFPDSLHNEGFGLIYYGYFNVNAKGIYEFALNSDDGSALFINDQLVVNNDGIHGKKNEYGAIALNKGVYKVKILYFQTTGFQHFNLQVIKPDQVKINLKPNDFFH